MSNNLAARAGRWSAEHRKAAILGWIAFVLLATGLGAAVGGLKAADGADLGVGDDKRGAQILDRSFPDRRHEDVLVRGAGADAAARDVERRLRAVDVVGDVRRADRRGDAVLLRAELRSSGAQAVEDVDDVLAATAAAQRAHPGLQISQFGEASLDRDLEASFAKDFEQAERLSLPLTLVILLVAFGSLVAAGLPLVLAFSAVLATIGLLAGVSQVWPMEETVNSVVLLIGLAVGVDYSLFYLRREREERAAGRSDEAALLAAAATSGRAVLISGLTVMIAMGGMYVAGVPTFTAMATGSILVVGVALIASVTVLPALLSKLGPRVERGRVPILGRRSAAAGEGRLWGVVLDRVLRRPKLAAALSAGVLLALTAPVVGFETAQPSMDTISRDVAAMRAYDRIQAAFPGEIMPATIAVAADDVRRGPVAAALRELVDRAAATPGLGRASVDVSPDGTVARVRVPIAGDGTGEVSQTALERLRSDVIPATVGRVPGVVAPVTGLTAATVDFNDLMAERMPLVFAFVLALAFVLLLVTFRSVVIPLKAIALNLLSVGAAYGVLTLVFVHGWFESLLGFESSGAVISWLPLFLFVILFGLSMDYHVFILTRVREAVDRGMSTEDAVAHGIRTTAGVVTSAAAIMVAVFAVFATLSAVEFKQLGVGLAVAIALDATIVRAVLLPASMKLLGEWNWYLPRRLQWLPRVEHAAA